MAGVVGAGLFPRNRLIPKRFLNKKNVAGVGLWIAIHIRG
jgi:hypothetical protein